MERNSTVFRHWDDVVFENRNKNYGAYLLRRAYADRLLSGLGVTLIFFTLILSLQDIYSTNDGHELVQPPLSRDGLELQPPPVFREKPPRNAERQPRITNTQNRQVLVTREEVIEPEQVDAVESFVSGQDFGTGDPFEGIEGAITAPIMDPAPVVEEKTRTHAEVMPQYEGGLEAMMKFIRKKIRYPRAPREMGIDGTVYVGFVVNGDGSVSDVKIIKGVHPDYDDEAMRVISMLPSWKGGRHNGRPVSVRMVLPIKFDIK